MHLPALPRAAADLGATASTIQLTLTAFLVGLALTFAPAFAAMFASVSGSPFVLQDTLGLSTGAYAVAFGANASGLVGASVLSGRLVTPVGPGRLLAGGAGPARGERLVGSPAARSR